eukprot:447349-Alexandrium_andersonii.AAC.1
MITPSASRWKLCSASTVAQLCAAVVNGCGAWKRRVVALGSLACLCGSPGGCSSAVGQSSRAHTRLHSTVGSLFSRAI